MRGAHICVAGVDLETHEHVRPVHGHLGRALLAANGGSFDLASYVDLGNTEPIPDPPHIEDVSFEPDRVRGVGEMDPEDYLELLELISFKSLREAFGADLQRATLRKLATEEGHGDRSLACVRPPGRLSLSYGVDYLELHFTDEDDPAAAKVTDLRYFDATGEAVSGDLARELADRLRQGRPAWILFGLGRALEGTRVPGSWHWLQVNGICFEDDPLWPS